ncbi:MAG: DNA cytosine methyltransferase [Oscillospiraceae bacterium]|jgi:DNA (cytosine-5)-methyltransferase 1|nr:DNA cytosine methyltransferase [Oscillospiraceae bacterium]
MLTIEQIAETTKTSIKSIRREIAMGSLPSIKQNNRYYVQISDLSYWQQEQEKVDKNNSNSTNFQKSNNTVNWIDISDEMLSVDGFHNKEQIENINFIDLFAGAGGLSCGLKMAGFNPVESVEIMEQAVATYNRNFGKNNLPCDIRNENNRKALIKKTKSKHIHLISGGFPCQGFSLAGHRIVNDERNSLYLEMLKIVEEIKPDFVLMENVEGLRSMLGGLVEQQIIEDYKNIGYDINVTVLNSADYGVPQIRKRVIFIGNRMGKKNLHPKPFLNPDNYKTVADAVARFCDIPENKSINHIFTKHNKEMTKRLADLPEGQSLYGNYSDAWKKVYWNKPSVTVKENHGGVNVHPKFPRVMTPRELAALQSFPDDFIFEGSKKWQLVQIGNAVPPLLGKAIGLAIKKALLGVNEEEIFSQNCPQNFSEQLTFEEILGE